MPRRHASHTEHESATANCPAATQQEGFDSTLNFATKIDDNDNNSRASTPCH